MVLAVQHEVSAGGRHKAVRYRAAWLGCLHRRLPQDGGSCGSPASQQSCLENCLQQGICYCHSLHTPAATPTQSLRDRAPLHCQRSLVKVMNATLQREKSTAGSATETFHPSAVITNLSQNCSESEKFKHGCSGQRQQLWSEDSAFVVEKILLL